MSSRINKIKTDMYAIYIACKHPKVPWYAKALAAFVVAYLLSPVDLIPDFIPIIGFLDDIIIVPLGIAIVLRLIPKDIWEECRQKASNNLGKEPLSKNWFAGAVIILIWLFVVLLFTVFLHRFISHRLK